MSISVLSNLKLRTQVIFLSNVRASKSWMELFTVLKRPIFAGNPSSVMKHSEQD